MKKKLQYVIFLFLLSCLLYQCNSRSESKILIDRVDSLSKINSSFKYPNNVKKISSISQLYNDSNELNLTDEGSFWLLYFKPKKVFFDFNPSCGYWFPTSLDNDTIVFFWANNMNCNFDRGLSKTFKGIKSPEIGKPFGRITLSSDTTMQIEYLYKEWVLKINKESEKTIDTLFPSSFKIIQL